MRTPITGVVSLNRGILNIWYHFFELQQISSVDLLENTYLTKEQRSLVGLTRVCARSLLDTINGIHI